MTNEIQKRALNIDNSVVANAFNRGMSKAEMIVNYYKDGATGDQVTAFMSKKGISESYVLEAIEKLEAISNRTLHTFDTLDALNEFKKNNNCGQQWLNSDNNFCIYSY